MSTTNTRVSVPLMPALELPFDPYPSEGGITIMTLDPTRTPGRPSFQPGMTSPPSLNANGSPSAWAEDGQEALNTLPVRQMAPTYWATTVWPVVSFGPVPCTSVVTDSFEGGLF